MLFPKGPTSTWRNWEAFWWRWVQNWKKKKIYAFDSKVHLCPIFWVPTKRMSYKCSFMSHLLGPKIKGLANLFYLYLPTGKSSGEGSFFFFHLPLAIQQMEVLNSNLKHHPLYSHGNWEYYSLLPHNKKGKMKDKDVEIRKGNSLCLLFDPINFDQNDGNNSILFCTFHSRRGMWHLHFLLYKNAIFQHLEAQWITCWWLISWQHTPISE